MSNLVLDRLVEEKAQTDPELRKRRPLLSTARAMGDEELLEKLLPLFGDLDREAFRRLCASYLSAQEMVEGHEIDGPGRFDADWPWLAAAVAAARNTGSAAARDELMRREIPRTRGPVSG